MSLTKVAIKHKSSTRGLLEEGMVRPIGKKIGDQNIYRLVISMSA